MLSTNFEEILGEQSAVAQAVIRMPVEGYVDTEIADTLSISHSAVRMRTTRFGNALYDAVRHQRNWIPEQLHTKASASHRTQRGAA
ncbi:hypothetical protein ACFQ6S_42025 [Streptomyces sp. NPDC056479]|uniref:hypothetical protein n=1 Tax=Streptomyces sp. NPDC056479 TaxID=3345832 RepID=UPI0036AA13EA